METKNVILELRTKRGLSQDELAEKIMVTRQAVSRWENGETVPNTDTLKLLSKVFDVSINTLLGQPRRLICQCCGMPLEDEEERQHTFEQNEQRNEVIFSPCEVVHADKQRQRNQKQDEQRGSHGALSELAFFKRRLHQIVRPVCLAANGQRKHKKRGKQNKSEAKRS